MNAYILEMENTYWEKTRYLEIEEYVFEIRKLSDVVKYTYNQWYS